MGYTLRLRGDHSYYVFASDLSYLKVTNIYLTRAINLHHLQIIHFTLMLACRFCYSLQARNVLGKEGQSQKKDFIKYFKLRTLYSIGIGSELTMLTQVPD